MISVGKDKFSVQHKDDIHRAEVKWLQEEIAKAKEAKETVIVMTHHSPTLHNVSAPSEKLLDELGIHSTNLHHVFGEPVHTWAFGHTHWNSRQQLRGTRLVTN